MLIRRLRDKTRLLSQYGLSLGDAMALVDRDWYLRMNPDVRESGTDPVMHALTYGILEGRRPNEFFDPQWYYQAHTDIPAGTNVLLHYVSRGWKENRRPSKEFDPNFFLPDSADADKSSNPLRRYLERRRLAVPTSEDKRIEDTQPTHPGLVAAMQDIVRSQFEPIQLTRIGAAAAALRSTAKTHICDQRPSVHLCYKEASELSELFRSRNALIAKRLTRSTRANTNSSLVLLTRDGLDVQSGLDRALGENWHPIESWGVWSAAPAATLRFRLENPRPQTILRFRLIAWIPTLGRQTVTIQAVGGNAVQAVFSNNHEEERHVDLPLDRECLGDNFAVEISVNVLQAEKAVSAGDDRVLGAGLMSISLAT